MRELEISEAKRGDIDGVFRLEQAAFPAPWRREFFESELYADGRFNLVARRGREVVAYVFAMWFFDEMHVNKIAVAASERRRGIAADLMERCFEFSRAHQIRTITLEVRQSNVGAQEFYRKLEFEASYVRPRYYPDGEAAVVMTKAVSDPAKR